MGSKYTTQAVSGYNASPPPDDGSTSASNKITWAGIKSKLADTVLTLTQAINTALVAALDTSPNSQTTTYTTVAGDNWKTIEVTGTTTISLGDAATMTAGYTLQVVNAGTNTVTVSRATALDTLNGATKNIKLAPGAAVQVKVIAAATGYEITAAFNTLFDQTDPSKQITHSMASITTGTVRTVTWPDANITVARSDAAQTFTGLQTFATGIAVTGAITATATATNYISNSVNATNLDAMSKYSDGTATWFAGINGANTADSAYRIALQGTGPLLKLDSQGQVSFKNHVYPGDQSGALQSSVGIITASGIPSNANGSNNDWCLSDNGHIYFKAGGTWSAKV